MQSRSKQTQRSPLGGGVPVGEREGVTQAPHDSAGLPLHRLEYPHSLLFTTRERAIRDCRPRPPRPAARYCPAIAFWLGLR